MLNRLLCRGWIGNADALLDLIYQAGATFIGGEVPDQDPADQDDHRHELDKRGNLFIGLEFRDASTIGRIRAVKKSNDLEERTIEDFYPSGIRFLHAMIYGCWLVIRCRSDTAFYLWLRTFDRKSALCARYSPGMCVCWLQARVTSIAGLLTTVPSQPRSLRSQPKY